MIEPDGPVAQCFEGFERVRKAQHGLASATEIHDPILAFLEERLVTDTQPFVDDENIGVDVHGQATENASRIIMPEE